MNTFWDARYAAEHFVYGKEPNGFFASELGNLTPGKLLLSGEGEGKNAVHAAVKGREVEALSFSKHFIPLNWVRRNYKNGTYGFRTKRQSNNGGCLDQGARVRNRQAGCP